MIRSDEYTNESTELQEKMINDFQLNSPNENINYNKIVEQFRNDPKTIKMQQFHKVSVHIAVLVLRGKIIAQATNRICAVSPKKKGFSRRTIHAEKNVIRSLGDYSKMRNADMYVIRCGRGENNEKFFNSKPCYECECFLNKCISKYGLKNVYYTTE
jgi:hypothetical protein